MAIHARLNGDIVKIQTALDNPDKEKYPCFNAIECSASWTYDDWHCTGCVWKGMGTADLKFGSQEMRDYADELKKQVWMLKNPKIGN